MMYISYYDVNFLKKKNMFNIWFDTSHKFCKKNKVINAKKNIKDLQKFKKGKYGSVGQYYTIGPLASNVIL